MALEKSEALGAFLKKLIVVCSFGTLGRRKENSNLSSGDKVHEHFEGDNTQKNMTILWSELPEDIYGEILDKIDCCRDFVNFSFVCKLWSSITQKMNSHLPCNLSGYHFLPRKNPLPMLLQPCGEGEERHYLYSITEQKVYGGLHIPEIINKRIPGMAYGWLVTFDINDLQINLLNPLSRVQISLPPINAFPKPLYSDHDDHDIFKEFQYNYRFFISSDPSVDRGNCLIFAYKEYSTMLCYCRIGDERWTKFESCICLIHDMILYKGVLYAINILGTLYSIEINLSNEATIVARLISNERRQHYLVESNGNLLLLVGMPENCRTQKFNVYQLVDSQIGYLENFPIGDLQEHILRSTWKEITSLDGQMLFIGNNVCLSRDPSLYPRMKENCIYFADNYSCIYNRTMEGIFEHPHDIGVYHMENGEISYLTGLSESSSRMLAIWLSPNP